jgi:hypothetical protein
LHVEGPKKAEDISIVPVECSNAVEGEFEPLERQQ